MTDYSGPWRHRWVAIALGVVAAGVIATLALVAAAGTTGDDATPTPSPTPSPTATPSPTPEAETPTPRPDAPDTAFQIVYREFGAIEDVIWRALPADPSQRVEMARIPHREGFGVKPSLSPDGRKLAYLSLPAHALSAQSSQAEAFVLDFESQKTERVAVDVDLTFAPLWSPDGEYLYMRRLAGPEFLASDVIIIRVAVPPVGETTPRPTPPPVPPETPAPTRPAEEDALRESVGRVLNFIPVGFADDGESMLFVQIRGGTQQGSLLGSFKPATTEALEEAWQEYLDLLAELAPTQSPEATLTPAGSPTPTPTPTPAPTPAPTPFWKTGLVVTMSDQITFDYDLSPDLNKLLYLAQEFTPEGVIANRAHWADVAAKVAQPVEAGGLPPAYHLRPLWHPDSVRVTLGVLPFDGSPGRVVVMQPDGTSAGYLASAGSGFDEPRSWAPDGSWLAVSHSEGDSLANRGNVSLALVASTGLRATVIEGADNATEDSVLGWLQVEE